MFQRKPRRFRRRMNDRSGMPHSNGGGQIRIRQNSFSNGHGHSRNKFKTTLSAEKLFEKYNVLAKEALSSGDKTLSENYLQHADHFIRIIEDRNRNQIQARTNLENKPSTEESKPSTEESKPSQDDNSAQEVNTDTKK